LNKKYFNPAKAGFLLNRTGACPIQTKPAFGPDVEDSERKENSFSFPSGVDTGFASSYFSRFMATLAYLKTLLLVACRLSLPVG